MGVVLPLEDGGEIPLIVMGFDAFVLKFLWLSCVEIEKMGSTSILNSRQYLQKLAIPI
jgi:hypothetical protein